MWLAIATNADLQHTLPILHDCTHVQAEISTQRPLHILNTFTGVEALVYTDNLYMLGT